MAMAMDSGMTMTGDAVPFPVRFDVPYPETLSRWLISSNGFWRFRI